MSNKKMSARQWMQSRSALAMWRSLPDDFPDRLSRLFAVACRRRIGPLLQKEVSRAAVEPAERSADEPIDESELDRVPREASESYENAMTDESGHHLPADAPTQAAIAASDTAIPNFRRLGVPDVLISAANASPLGDEEEDAAQATSLRDIVGDRSRKVSFDPARLAWGDRLVERLAEGIHGERAFDRMPILGDALEDAGCTDEAILAHCRGAGPHARGCWVIDLVLGRR